MGDRCKDLVLLARGEKTIEEINSKKVNLLTPQRRKSFHIVQNVPSPGAYEDVHTNYVRPAQKCQRSKSHNPTSARSLNEIFSNMSATEAWVFTQDFTADRDENIQSSPIPEPPTNSIATDIGYENRSSIMTSFVSSQSGNINNPQFGIKTRGGQLNKLRLTRKGVRTLGGFSTTNACDTETANIINRQYNIEVDNENTRSLSPEPSPINIISVATVHYCLDEKKKIIDSSVVSSHTDNNENPRFGIKTRQVTKNDVSPRISIQMGESLVEKGGKTKIMEIRPDIDNEGICNQKFRSNKEQINKNDTEKVKNVTDHNENIISSKIPRKKPRKNTEQTVAIKTEKDIENSQNNILEKRLQDIVGINEDIGNVGQDEVNKVTDLTDAELLDALQSDEDADVDLDGDLENREELVNLQHIILDELVSGEEDTESDEEVANNIHDDVETWFDNSVPKQQLNFERDGTVLNEQPDGDSPVDYFFLLADDIFFQFIIDRANSNAVKLLSHTTAPNSRMKAWRNITITEIKTFFGLLFHMGIIKLNRVSDYWKKDFLFNIPCFTKCMSRNRFLLIFRALHFEEPNSDSSSRLSKITPLVDYFNNKMRKIYYPSRNLSIDESVVLFRGRLIFRQYLKGKRHSDGIKLYILTDMHGIILKIIVYGGAGDPIVGGTNHTEKVVLNLLADYLNVGHSLYIDNFYTSVSLARKLIDMKTYCTGTLRTNRKGNPTTVTGKKLKKGEIIAKFSSSGICVLKWRDRRDVLLLSTEFDAKMAEVRPRFGAVIQKPEIVTNYNKYMGGIDHQDQMLAYYSCERKCLRWYKKLGVHIFQQMLYNSFTLCNIFSGRTKISIYEFKLSVIENLLASRAQPEPQRFSDVHVLQPCPRKRGSKGRKLRRRCKFCWTQNKQRKDTGHYCPDCPEQPGFCEVDCFRLYHKY